MLTRATLPARRIKVAGIRLNKDKRRALVDRIAAAMSRSEPTAFSLEGELRHRLRSSLCRQGADWILADLLAAAIVEDALRKVGAQRPTWQQGQPEWRSEEHTSELQSLMRISYAVFCLKKKKK